MTERNKPELDKGPKIDLKRRMIGRAGMATPVIMSVFNKAALGQTPYNCSISGVQSGNASGTHGTPTRCNVGYSITIEVTH